MNVYVASRVEAGSGHPGHVLSWIWNWFIKYPGLIRILHWITCVNNSVWSLSSNELSMLGSDDGSVFVIYLEKLTVQLEYFFDHLVLRKIIHSCMSQNYRALSYYSI